MHYKSKIYAFPLAGAFRLIIVLLISLLSQSSEAQVIFWTESFSNGCTSGCTAASYTTGPNGAWSSANTGTNATSANVWYVSGAEDGMAAGNCGTAGSDPSLHVGSTTLGDIGAAYDASRNTNRRAQSPVINCTGRSGLTLNLNYIENGEGTLDDCIIEYFNGTAWATLTNSAKTSVCSNGQGQWTALSVALPTTANNNANVRIGFRWTNNNVSGTDPSFAVDDITLSCTGGASCTVLPIELLSFTATPVGGHVRLDWATATETNNEMFIIERTINGAKYTEAGRTAGAGNSTAMNEYVIYDEKPLPGISYYRLKQVDYNGDHSYSPLAAVDLDTEISSWFNVHLGDEGLLIFLDEETENLHAEIIDVAGRIITSEKLHGNSRQHSLNISMLQKGMYFIRVSDGWRQGVQKFSR